MFQNGGTVMGSGETDNNASGNRSLQRLSRTLHRDLGYFFLTLIIVYSLSGIALNHIDDWNPDFIVEKKKVDIPNAGKTRDFNDAEIRVFGKLVGEENYKTYDYPTNDQLKIYYDNASLHINFSAGSGNYEKVRKRHLFYEMNVLHRNSLKQWKWVSDIFGFFLIVICVTGLLIPQGKRGPLGAGKWYLLAGVLLPVAGIVLFYIFT